ncbi:unnamed protein product [Amoebophrya sp. A25]|nr:unnamed protein product [Amoebophrya sp. A25]|eukprot:GSA25T00014817001.1
MNHLKSSRVEKQHQVPKGYDSSCFLHVEQVDKIYDIRLRSKKFENKSKSTEEFVYHYCLSEVGPKWDSTLPLS